MSKKQIKSNSVAGPLTSLLFISLVTAFSSTAVAATNSETASYVDSVFSWGPWELDIEPAAGGIQVPATGPLNARDAKLKLRPNSITALAPPTTPAPVIINTIPVPPTPPVIDRGPPAPTTLAPVNSTPTTTVTLPSF